MRLYFVSADRPPSCSDVLTCAYNVPQHFGFKYPIYRPTGPFGPAYPLPKLRGDHRIGDVSIDDFKVMVHRSVPFGLGKNVDTIWVAHIEGGWADINRFECPCLPKERLSQEGAKEGGEQKVAYVKGVFETAEEAKTFLAENTYIVHSISELKDNIVYFHNEEFDMLIGRDNAEDADLHQDVIYKGEFPNEIYPVKGMF